MKPEEEEAPSLKVYTFFFLFDTQKKHECWVARHLFGVGGSNLSQSHLLEDLVPNP
jgi:hypothetical protein